MMKAYISVLLFIVLSACDNRNDFLKVRFRNSEELRSIKADSSVVIDFDSIVFYYHIDNAAVVRALQNKDSSEFYSDNCVITRGNEFKIKKGAVTPILYVNIVDERNLVMYYNQNFEMLVAVDMGDENPQNLIYFNNSAIHSESIQEILADSDNFILNANKPKYPTGIILTP